MSGCPIWISQLFKVLKYFIPWSTHYSKWQLLQSQRVAICIIINIFLRRCVGKLHANELECALSESHTCFIKIIKNTTSLVFTFLYLLCSRQRHLSCQMHTTQNSFLQPWVISVIFIGPFPCVRVGEWAGSRSSASGEMHPVAQKTWVYYTLITERRREIQQLPLNHCKRREWERKCISQLQKHFQEDSAIRGNIFCNLTSKRRIFFTKQRVLFSILQPFLISKVNFILKQVFLYSKEYTLYYISPYLYLLLEPFGFITFEIRLMKPLGS